MTEFSIAIRDKNGDLIGRVEYGDLNMIKHLVDLFEYLDIAETVTIRKVSQS